MKQRVVDFLSAIAGTPVSNRKSGLTNRTTSLRNRALALGFLIGVASSLALWILDKWSSGAKVGEPKPADAGI